MKKPFSTWLLVIALAAHLVSPAISAMTVTGQGVWSVSCSGKSLLLPIPGESEQVNQHHNGTCPLCCDESRYGDALSDRPRPLYTRHNAQTYGQSAAATTATQRSKGHPARAPPVFQ